MNTFAASIITPPHVYYLVVDADLTLIARPVSLPAAIAPSEAAQIGSSLYDCFPEIHGCEDIFAEIIAGEQADFNFKAVNRGWNGEDYYFDLYFQQYQQPEQPNPAYLLVFVEDVTDKMKLEQVLVQSTNESALLLSALTRSRNYTNQIVTSIADALIVTTPDHHIKTVNQATAKLFGYDETDLLDQPLSRLIVEPDAVIPILDSFLRQRQTEAQTFEILCQTQNGSQLLVALSCSLVHPPTTHPEGIESTVPNLVYIGRDITERQRTQQRLKAQYAIAKILSESVSLDRATHRILQAIGESLGWDIGEFWVPKVTDDRKAIPSDLNTSSWLQTGQPCPIPVPRLQRVDYWANHENQFHIGITDHNHVWLSEGMTFAGQVWSAGHPQWLTALQDDAAFGTTSTIVQSGLRSAFAFPIHSDSEMLGVMTFFRSQQQPPDQHLLQMMTATGNQLGQFIKRKEAEVALHKQQATTERLLHNILPSPIVERLKNSPGTIADSFEEVTVLFADLVGFTEMAARLSPIELVERLNVIFSAFDQLCEDHNLEKIKTIGDAYMVVGGLPTPRTDHAETIANMALNMQKVISELNTPGDDRFGIRIGINTGSVVAGVIGTKKFSYDLWGDTVNTASRMESHGAPGQIQVTDSTYQRLKDRYQFIKRDPITVKGKGKMQTYWLMGNLS